MNDHLDLDSVIKALTDGIGPQLGRAVRSSYYELSGRLTKEKKFASLESANQQFIVDILALSIFYSVVVAPLESGQSLLTLAQKAKATHVRIGRDKLTPQIMNKLRRCVGAFYEILTSHKIPIEVLSFPTLESFVLNVQALLKKGYNEAVD